MAIVDGLVYKVKRLEMPYPGPAGTTNKPDFKEIEDFLNSEEMHIFIYMNTIDVATDKGNFTRYVDIYYQTKIDKIS